MNQMTLKSLAASFTLVIVAAHFGYSKTIVSDGPIAPCVVGRTAAPTGFWTWPINSQVNIYLREPDFSEEYVSAVRVAVENWDTAAVENGSHVHFIFHGLTRETKTGHGDLTIIRGDVYGKKDKHLALLEAHSLRNDQLIDYALVFVDLRVTNPEVLTNVMAHELGHSLGLLDCYECARKSSAMGLLKTGNEPNGIQGPTFCDQNAVLSVYHELTLHHIGPAPTTSTLDKKKAPDPGEEPEADDTPVVRRP